MPISLSFVPGSIVRWRNRRFVVVDHLGMETIIAREQGKRGLERIPIQEARPDLRKDDIRRSADLISVPEKAWQAATKQFKSIQPLLEMDDAKRTLADVQKVADALGKHPVTIYRWINEYKHAGRLSVFLRKERSDRGTSRLSKEIETIIDNAIKDIYLTAEQPNMVAVIECTDRAHR